MEYNTSRNHLTMKEYGRHIQKMVEYLLTLEDKDDRQKKCTCTNRANGLFKSAFKKCRRF